MALPELICNTPTPGQRVALGTLGAAMTDTTGLSMSMSAAAPTPLRAAVGQFRVVVDSEIMVVAASATGASPWTIITRGAEGSTAATHLISTPVYHYLTAGALTALVAAPGPAGGDLGGTYPNPGVTKINGVTVPLTGSAWVSLTSTLANSWAIAFVGMGDDPAYFKDPLGFVHLKGRIKSGASNSVALTLPAGFRPGSSYQIFSATGNTGGGVPLVATVGINKDSGIVTVWYATGINDVGLDGITFLAEN